MKSTTTIKAFAYPVIIKDHRTGEKFEDVIVLPKEWLQICGSDGVIICDDKHMIYRAYNVKGAPTLVITDGENHVNYYSVPEIKKYLASL